MDVPMAGGLAAKRGGGLPKLRELLRRQRRDSDSQNDSPDLDFVYSDTDTYTAEIAEFYSYTEEPEFSLGQKCFEEDFHCYVTEKWSQLDEERKEIHIWKMLNNVESAKRATRMKAARAILYLAQGVFGECSSEDDQMRWCKENVFLFYKCGVFTTFVELLCMEAENSVAASTALRKPAVSIVDSTDLRVVMSVLYIMIITINLEDPNDSEEYMEARVRFRAELSQPVHSDDSLTIVLFMMVTKFCSGHAPHFPIKKILLLLWKTVLYSLGTLSDLCKMKALAREAAGVRPVPEDTVEVAKNMRASSPPTGVGDILDPTKRANKANIKKSLVKQNGIDEPMPGESGNDDEENGKDENSDDDDDEIDDKPPDTPREPRILPWTPKVREKELDNFLDHTRAKFVGYQVSSDRESLAGLPLPIHEGVSVLKKHLYVSLTELQIKKEEEINKHPLSMAEESIPNNATEILYLAMLPNLPQYMISLLKILLAAAPTSKAKTDSINILADVLPEEMPITVPMSMKLGIDVNRHKEIIVKSISALLLLLLKHFKLNHVYQFEFMSQHLVFANCIPLVLKFFNQNIQSHIGTKNSIHLIDFPYCVIGDQPELTAESLEAGDNELFCWRNVFACINLLRILNKLTKWKHSRTMMLVVFKSAPILKRALKVKQPMMQLYVLKLLKVQTKYLGRQWRKSNMKTMSAIYSKVRHRLNDDWVYGNEVKQPVMHLCVLKLLEMQTEYLRQQWRKSNIKTMSVIYSKVWHRLNNDLVFGKNMDARPWDFQAEECALRACVDRFNSRRYEQSSPNKDPELDSVDNNLQSVLGQCVDLSEEFKRFYEVWLDREVFSTQIDWDLLLKDNIIV